ncbi:hypothetical protein DO70_5134 [Burkholderia pseudomallei]|nr:hypothetical protein DO70_5134 [Burkholderia pseudomallei]
MNRFFVARGSGFVPSAASAAVRARRLAFGVWRLAFSVQRSAFSVQRSAFSVQRSAFSVQRRTRVFARVPQPLDARASASWHGARPAIP